MNCMSALVALFNVNNDLGILIAKLPYCFQICSQQKGTLIHKMVSSLLWRGSLSLILSVPPWCFMLIMFPFLLGRSHRWTTCFLFFIGYLRLRWCSLLLHGSRCLHRMLALDDHCYQSDWFCSQRWDLSEYMQMKGVKYSFLWKIYLLCLFLISTISFIPFHITWIFTYPTVY